MAQGSSFVIRRGGAHAVVGEHGLRISVAKIDDAYAREKSSHGRVEIAVILGHKVLVGKRCLFAGNPIQDANLPASERASATSTEFGNVSRTGGRRYGLITPAGATPRPYDEPEYG